MKLSEERVRRRIVSLRRGANSGVLNEVWSVVAEDTATILETLLSENKALRDALYSADEGLRFMHLYAAAQEDKGRTDDKATAD